MLTPEARGIYRDVLGHLYLQKDRCGHVTGTREELARAGRCTALQMDLTLKELAKFNVAEVQERNGVVTLINRRLQKCKKRRENGRIRVENHRQNGAVTPVKRDCNASGNAIVTPPPHTPPLLSSDKGNDKALSPLSPYKERGTGKTTAEVRGQKSQGRIQRSVLAPRPSPLAPPSRALTSNQRSLADRFEIVLGHQWPNDAGKWVNRIKEFPKKTERVLAEVESATKENRVRETPAQYAEQIWKEFR